MIPDMHDVNLAALDLNLLHVLCTVLEEQSATRAARRLHVTQSAVSNALRRARGIFDDPLVLRRPHGLEPTPRGAALLPALSAWVEEARRLVSEPPSFDPARTVRTFRIACVDAIAVTLLAPILRGLRRSAPGARLRMVTLDRLLAADGLVRGEVDLLVGMPPLVPEGHEAELLYRDPMSCIVRRDQPGIGRQLSLGAFAALPHVDLALFHAVDDTIDRALARHGQTRTVQVALPHFSSLPLAVLETRGVATIATRLARSFARLHPLRVVAPPRGLALPTIEIRQVWHRRAEGDGAIRFLREVVRRAAGAGGTGE